MMISNIYSRIHMHDLNFMHVNTHTILGRRNITNWNMLHPCVQTIYRNHSLEPVSKPLITYRRWLSCVCLNLSTSSSRSRSHGSNKKEFTIGISMPRTTTKLVKSKQFFIFKLDSNLSAILGGNLLHSFKRIINIYLKPHM